MSSVGRNEFLARLRELYERWGANRYDEQVSQLEHAVQCAHHARIDGADAALVVATLLHDIGHLLALENSDGSVDVSVNDTHEATGAAYLARHFSPAVTAPIALHVEAKRYLCTVEDDYFASLSVGSVRSLAVQGGRMSPDEVERFQRHPAAERAVALRRWDERGKSLTPSGLSFDDFASELLAVSTDVT
ncbi:MAG: metal-dependent phosphohydrolase [Actinobacteria bacterium]|jgi:phosphonate degradation associated HDIG domain protein|nr:metal-dependent phosphohydrolase [Actinomycetota bacterium]NDG76384.1 metal-dependent phosphohydrolase [Acidimicrobiia bacterium]NBO33504.1 metal-dependent phosphohydrolase [Actinomycetota bacterium]NBO79641.1 metal-dependent phosphohydrolase [Actinomycetota bacterium]NBP17628.1 metal-dependent phosphohydrolase [Actinomycetota bacterium]